MLDALFSQSEEGTRNVPFSSLFATIPQMIHGFKKTYIVIDALDECTECGDILETLKTMHMWREAELHVLVTGRRTSQIGEVLTELASDRLCVHESPIHDDIDSYLTECLASDRKLTRLPTDVRGDIYKTLINHRECKYIIVLAATL